MVILPCGKDLKVVLFVSRGPNTASLAFTANFPRPSSHRPNYLPTINIGSIMQLSG